MDFTQAKSTNKVCSTYFVHFVNHETESHLLTLWSLLGNFVRILYNLKDDKVIYEKSPDDRVNIASLTKIMTALVAIENIDDYNKQIIITRKMLENLPNDLSKVGFKVGEVVTYNDLIYGILLKSGADATNSVAISVSGNIDEFVKLMNKKAEELDMNNSSFSNTIGIEGDNHYSTARDISKLLK